MRAGRSLLGGRAICVSCGGRERSFGGHTSFSRGDRVLGGPQGSSTMLLAMKQLQGAGGLFFQFSKKCESDSAPYIASKDQMGTRGL